MDSIGEIQEAFELYEDSLKRIRSLVSGKGDYNFEFKDKEDLGELQMYYFEVSRKKDKASSYALVQMRGEGTNKHLEKVEYDGESRINFLFSNQPIPKELDKPARKEALTFRLDRECLEFDATGKKVVGRDNTRANGRLSLDLGSIYEDSGRANNILGRVMSIGNYHANQERRKQPEFYHNRESFYEELGQADVFKEIVNILQKYLEERYIHRKVVPLSKAA